MGGSEQQRGIQAARAMEKRGQLDAACQAYLRSGAVEDAARLLGSLRRYGEAADTLMQHLGVTPSTASGLATEPRRLALKAAIYLTRAERNEEAVELLLALGEPSRAAEVLERIGNSVEAARILSGGKRTPSGRWSVSAGPETTAQRLEAAGQVEQAIQAYIREGRPGAAALLSKQLGRLEDAAQLFAEAGMSYDAARCYLQLGNRRQALQNLVRVSRDSQQYPAAAREAIRLADKMNVLEHHFEHFLTDYIRRGPQDELDLESFYVLGQIYERWNYVENADEAWRKVLERDPEYRDTQSRLAGLEEARQRQRDRLERSLKGESGFWGPSQGTPEDLPDLPDLPPAPGSAPSPAPAPGPEPGASAAEPAAGAGPPRKGGTRVLTGSDAVPQPPSSAPSQAPPPPAPPPSPPSASENVRFLLGETIAHRYRLEEQIGEGGMAEVFRAYDMELDEAIAMKVFRSSLTDDDSLARFRQEIKLSRQLQQPNVTRVYDLGMSGGRRYLTMELLEGQSLEDKLAAGFDLAPGVEVLVQACAGLQAAHDLGIIHRDIKPDNLFITKAGLVKVMDFGIAKQQSAQGFTVMGTIAGTPEYMSPEQVNNFTNVTPATDLYALGIVAFRMFTGKLPFEHEELVPLLVMQVQDPPPAPRSLNPKIPASLERVVLKLLEKDPGDRFASCRELASALEALRKEL